MGDTVSNANRTICTKGSSHTAMSTAPDVCKTIFNVPNAYDNTVQTSKAGSGKTSRTFIQSKNIVVARTHVGPPSEAAHAGLLGGVKSGTYRFEAKGTSWSSDVITEGDGVVRTFDSTYQNHDNTVGIIQAGLFVASAESAEERKRKKCQIKTLSGICSHGRKLGWPTPKQDGEARYLEVRCDDYIKFAAGRWDITQSPHEPQPKCDDEHTSWIAEANQHPWPNKKKKITKKGVDAFTVPAIMAVDTTVMRGLGVKFGDSDQGYDEGLDHGTERPGEEPNWKQNKKDLVGAAPKGAKNQARANARSQRDSWRQNDADRKAGKWSKFNQKPVEIGRPGRRGDTLSESAKVNIRELLTYWLWRANPPTITVTATACSGSKDATIKVFPHKKYEFAVSMGRSAQKKSDSSKAGKDPIDVFKATLMAIKRTTDVASKVAKLAGEKLQIKLMQGFVFKWEIEYKENTETKGWYRAKKYTPATVGRDWTITFAAKPIIGVDASISFSLLNLVVPCMGQTVGTLLRKARIVRADVVFAAMIGMYANIQFGKDEYDYPKFKGVNIGVDATLSMALVFGTAGIDVLELKAAFPCNFNNNFNTSKKKGCLIAWTPKFTARSNFTLTIFPDRWWEIEAAHASPSWLRIQWPRVPKPIDLFTAPG